MNFRNIHSIDELIKFSSKEYEERKEETGEKIWKDSPQPKTYILKKFVYPTGEFLEPWHGPWNVIDKGLSNIYDIEKEDTVHFFSTEEDFEWWAREVFNYLEYQNIIKNLMFF